MDVRPPPLAPPPYAQAIQRVYSRPLRPVVLFISAVTLIWSLVLGIKFTQDRESDSETKRMKIFDLILAILFFCVAGIETFGIIAVAVQKIVWTRAYFVAAGVGGLLTMSAELIRVIAHFVVKKDLIDDCRNELTGAKAETLSGAIANIDASEAQRLCDDDWQRGVWWDLGWLVLTSSLALLFTGLVGAYYYQLLDPSLSRTRTISNVQPMPIPVNSPYPRPNNPHNDSILLQSYHHGHLEPQYPQPMTSYQTTAAADAPFVPPQYAHPPEYRPKHDDLGNQHQVDDKKEGLVDVNLSSSH